MGLRNFPVLLIFYYARALIVDGGPRTFSEEYLSPFGGNFLKTLTDLVEYFQDFALSKISILRPIYQCPQPAGTFPK